MFKTQNFRVSSGDSICARYILTIASIALDRLPTTPLSTATCSLSLPTPMPYPLPLGLHVTQGRLLLCSIKNGAAFYCALLWRLCHFPTSVRMSNTLARPSMPPTNRFHAPDPVTPCKGNPLCPFHLDLNSMSFISSYMNYSCGIEKIVLDIHT